MKRVTWGKNVLQLRHEPIQKFHLAEKGYILVHVYLPEYNFSMALTGVQVAFLYDKKIHSPHCQGHLPLMGCIY